MIPTLFGTSIIIFFLFALLPGDYIDSNPKLTPERAQELRELYGLNKPIIERYFHWLVNALHGDFGFSLQYQEPVTSLLNKFIWNTFIVVSCSLYFSLGLLLLLLGLFLQQNSWFDRLVTIGVFATMSFPSFLSDYF